MEELLELRACLEQQRYADALLLLGELEEMSKEDKIHKIHNYILILLIHLIKQQAEQRTTRSWEFSIRYSVRAVQQINKRRKAGGYYLTSNELREIIAEAYETALEKAALEAFEGQYDEIQLSQTIDKATLLAQALQLIEPKES
ncbi:hypothetical protein THII_0545 [Thioploca ingrica]|uniref:DUF29 domain-containing protein n=1 Tax=Thioploca ingrica TaxID=40754 RepID=A0A090AHP7_9GAMM|nr:hypothetical protein THII_0545 [Thioploca ingrica]